MQRRWVVSFRSLDTTAVAMHCPGLPKPAQACPSLPKPAQACPSLPKPAQMLLQDRLIVLHAPLPAPLTIVPSLSYFSMT